VTGRLIALEGIDAAGKTTQARLLAEQLGALYTFQPGATQAGGAIRQLVLNPAGHGLNDRTEALLVIADKAQHVAEVVRPALEAGTDVVTDRYTASALAYQGYGRGLDIGALRSMLNFSTAGLEPDLNVLLDIGETQSQSRERAAEPPDRIERDCAAGGFAERVQLGYRMLAESDPDLWVVVDASGSVQQVADRTWAAVESRLRRPPTAGRRPTAPDGKRP